MSIRILQIHKRDSYEFRYIQDKYAINPDNNLFALADGTTQSFKSELWAEIITTEFIKNPNFNPADLISRFKKVVPIFKNTRFNFNANPAKASLERTKQSIGGTATFIGVQIKNDSEVEIISCGDSNLFHLGPKNIVKPFPYTNVKELDANNHFINTEVLLKNEVGESFFKQTTLECHPQDIIIMATDALSRLILKNPNTINELLNIYSFEKLHDFCLKKWENKELEEDDISAIIIPIRKTNKIQTIEPPAQFSFPKKEEVEFIPSSLSMPKAKSPTQTEPKSQPQSLSEWNELRTKVYAIGNDLFNIKSDLKLLRILLLVVIGLLLLNIILFYMIGLADKIGAFISYLMNAIKGKS